MSEPTRPLGIVEMDGDDLVGGPSGTALDSLRADFAEETANDLQTFPVQGRPRYEVRCSTRIPYDDLAAWRKKSEDKTKPGGTNELLLACIVLGNTCRGIVRDGEDIISDGKPLTFVSEALQNLLEVDRAVDAVRRFYGRDPNVIKAAGAVLGAAGYSGEDVTADPTPL
jgi:hypothetical protein